MICSGFNVLSPSFLFGLVFLCTHYRLSPHNHIIPVWPIQFIDSDMVRVIFSFCWSFHRIDFGWNLSNMIFPSVSLRRSKVAASAIFFLSSFFPTTNLFTRISIELFMLWDRSNSELGIPIKVLRTMSADTLFTVSLKQKLTDVHVHTYRLNGFHYSNHIIPEEEREKIYITSHSSIL